MLQGTSRATAWAAGAVNVQLNHSSQPAQARQMSALSKKLQKWFLPNRLSTKKAPTRPLYCHSKGQLGSTRGRASSLTFMEASAPKISKRLLHKANKNKTWFLKMKAILPLSPPDAVLTVPRPPPPPSATTPVWGASRKKVRRAEGRDRGPGWLACGYGIVLVFVVDFGFPVLVCWVLAFRPYWFFGLVVGCVGAAVA